MKGDSLLSERNFREAQHPVHHVSTIANIQRLKSSAGKSLKMENVYRTKSMDKNMAKEGVGNSCSLKNKAKCFHQGSKRDIRRESQESWKQKIVSKIFQVN